MKPKQVCSSLLVLLSLLFLPSLHSQELTLVDGTTTLVAAGDAFCFHQQTFRSDINNAVIREDCSGNRLTMFLGAGNTVLPKKVDISDSIRFVKQFQVKAVQGGPKNSFLPIFIAVPVDWKGGLFNDNIDPAVGPLAKVVGHANVNMFFRLTEGTPDNPGARGSTVEENPFMGASHAGITGCLSVPKTKVEAAKMLATCALAVLQRDEGSGNVYLSAVVETGKTYNIEIELLADVLSPNTGPLGPGMAHPLANFEATPITSAPLGFTWTDSMSITVGTDAQSLIQGLQNEITLLQQQLAELRNEFKTHTHVYLTGKGIGQNNTRATTTPPLTSP